MRHLKKCLLGFITLSIFFGCISSNKKKEVVYQTKFLIGSTNNKIEVLDFGGSGQPVLFLAGYGNSAHVFVDFAPKFCDNFHVYAMTRRSFGASQQTKNGFHLDTLTNDILSIVKSLNLNKVILIGHSLAGDEISKFASSYPDKVDKIIYLDAAHNRVDMIKLASHIPQANPPMPTKADSSSFISFKSMLSKSMGVIMPDEEIKAICIFGKNGKYIKDVSTDDILMKILPYLEHPNYAKINCPALALYAKPLVPSKMIGYYNQLDSINKKKADTGFEYSKVWVNKSIALFKKEMKNGIVKEIDSANHYIFLSHPVETEKLIRNFLN